MAESIRFSSDFESDDLVRLRKVSSFSWKWPIKQIEAVDTEKAWILTLSKCYSHINFINKIGTIFSSYSLSPNVSSITADGDGNCYILQRGDKFNFEGYKRIRLEYDTSVCTEWLKGRIHKITPNGDMKTIAKEHQNKLSGITCVIKNGVYSLFVAKEVIKEMKTNDRGPYYPASDHIFRIDEYSCDGECIKTIGDFHSFTRHVSSAWEIDEMECHLQRTTAYVKAKYKNTNNDQEESFPSIECLYLSSSFHEFNQEKELYVPSEERDRSIITSLIEDSTSTTVIDVRNNYIFDEVKRREEKDKMQLLEEKRRQQERKIYRKQRRLYEAEQKAKRYRSYLWSDSFGGRSQDESEEDDDGKDELQIKDVNAVDIFLQCVIEQCITISPIPCSRAFDNSLWIIASTKDDTSIIDIFKCL